MALVRSFTQVPATRRLNRKQTVCEFTVADDSDHGRLLILRTYSENRTETTTPAQVYDLDLAAARELRGILKEHFGI